MIREAVHNPVSIQGRPPGLSDVPSEALESIDSESLGRARALIDAEAGELSMDKIRQELAGIFTDDSSYLAEVGARRLPLVRGQWEAAQKKLASTPAGQTDERLRELLAQVEKTKREVAELELEQKILGRQTEDQLARTRDLIHQWTDICETQRRRKRLLVSQIV
jgi:hypothetical protein